MSITELLREPSVENLLSLATVDLVAVAGVVVSALAAAGAGALFLRRGPVYIPPTLKPPFWRRRVGYKLSAGAMLGLALAMAVLL